MEKYDKYLGRVVKITFKEGSTILLKVTGYGEKEIKYLDGVDDEGMNLRIAIRQIERIWLA